MEEEGNVKSLKIRMFYASASVVLLILEIILALFVRDSFVRPYLGDFFVVILLYCLVRIVLPEKFVWLPAAIFAFAVLVEVLQFFHIVELLHLSGSKFFRVLIGGVFDLKDILCYFFGCAACFALYYGVNRFTDGKAGGEGVNTAPRAYDPATRKPVIKCSICNGEQVAGFVDLETGLFEDILLIRNEDDLRKFKKQYGIEGDLEKIY